MQLSLIVKSLKAGGVGVLPTDTIYGVVARALNEKSVERVYQLKGRTPTKPCIILIADISDLSLFGITVGRLTDQLINRLWPGPVSIILPCTNQKFSYLHRGTNSLAFRLPADESLRTLLRETGPLIAPSANPEGQPPATTIEEAKKYFGDNMDFYLPFEAFAKKGEDAVGKFSGKPSTLVEIRGGKVVILRQGSAVIPAELL